MSLEEKESDLQERKKDMFKEIDLIQAIINRMATTSSLFKGWTVTLMTAILTFRGKEPGAAYLAIIPILLFWFLDAYFLRTEKSYRRLYQWIVTHRLREKTDTFSLNIDRFVKEEGSILKVMFSLTLIAFYGAATVLVAVYYFIFIW